MFRRYAAMMAVALALANGVTYGSDSFVDALGTKFQLHGYGTVGVVHSDLNTADFVTGLSQAQGAGHSGSWSPDVDSRLALQLEGKLTQRLSMVVQVISENQENNSWTGSPNPRYRPSLEWANVKYQINAEWNIQFGRIVLPLLMISDYRKVGYVNPFVRVPVEVYGDVPYTSNDGADVTFRKRFGSVINTLMVLDGSSSVRLGPPLGSNQARNLGVVDTVEVGSLTARAAYLKTPIRSVVGYGFPDFIVSAQAEGDPTAASMAQYLYERRDPSHWQNIDNIDLGATYDPGPWFVMGEFYRFTSAVFGDGNAGFVCGGIRRGAFTPYVILSRLKSYESMDPSIPTGGLSPLLAAAAMRFNGSIAGIDASNTSQTTVSAGLRWDFARHFDLKAQYDHVRPDTGSEGLFGNIQPDFVPGSAASVLSIAVDFAF